MQLSRIKEIGVEGLINARKRHDELGVRGAQKIPSPNQFGETALVVDIECEKAVFEVLKNNKFPIRIISEEHGVTSITRRPSHLGVVDGIDGTANYPGGRYATMLGIFSNTDPFYKDYLFSGLIEHQAGIIYYALPGEGTFSLNLQTSQLQRLQTSPKNDLVGITLYDASYYNQVSQDVFRGIPEQFNCQRVTSSAIAYADIAMGLAHAKIEVTRKRNLEQMIAFGLIEQAGGVMITLDGNSIGSQRYQTFAQKENSSSLEPNIPLITACSQEVALALRDRVLAQNPN